MSEEIKRPSLWLHLTEFFRALNERRRAGNFLKTHQPTEQVIGHPILIIPGFMASHLSTDPMRTFLDRLGYHTIDWGLGRNYARLEEIDVLSDMIDSIHKDHNQKLTIIGWSLGGIYARRLATLHADKTRRVITLGSPYRHLESPNYANWLYQLFQRTRSKEKRTEPHWVEELKLPIPVPSVAIYSKTDGIVPWQACMDGDDQTDHQNIEVVGSHIGLGMNQEVLGHVLAILEADDQVIASSAHAATPQ